MLVAMVQDNDNPPPEEDIEAWKRRWMKAVTALSAELTGKKRGSPPLPAADKAGTMRAKRAVPPEPSDG